MSCTIYGNQLKVSVQLYKSGEVVNSLLVKDEVKRSGCPVPVMCLAGVFRAGKAHNDVPLASRLSPSTFIFERSAL